MALGMPALANTAASCPAPLGISSSGKPRRRAVARSLRDPAGIHDRGRGFHPAVKLELDAALFADKAAFREEQIVEASSVSLLWLRTSKLNRNLPGMRAMACSLGSVSRRRR